MFNEFKADWAKANTLEKMRYMFILVLMIIVGFIGIYAALQWSFAGGDYRYLIITLCSVVLLLVLRQVKWKGGSKSESSNDTGD